MQTIKQLIADLRADNPAPATRSDDPIVGDVVSFDYHGKSREGVVYGSFRQCSVVATAHRQRKPVSG